MKVIRIDLSQLYIGDYFTDTLEFSSDQHTIFQTLLLCVWLSDCAKLNERKLRTSVGLSWSEWRRIRAPFIPLLEVASARVSYWKDSVKAYDGQRLPPREWETVRAIVMIRDDYICAYCGSKDDLHVDHRIPVSRGGPNTLNNLVTACGPCNQSKGPKLLEVWLAPTDPGNKMASKTHLKRRRAGN